MKSTLVSLIVALVRQLIGSDLWALIVIAVTQQDSTEKSGSEKREAVVVALRAMTSTVAGWLVNLAIEAAVAKLKVTK
jgi:hypothetical protein